MSHSAAYWSRRSSYDTTATSDTLTNFLNLSTSSRGDRSSSGSLPFAEEVIQQNQADWEQIERIFYGESPLPDDEKTREEFLDWMETFPYIRVVGKKVNTEMIRPNRNPIVHEEYIAVDPPDHRVLQPHKGCRNCSGFPGSRSGQILTRRTKCDCDKYERPNGTSSYSLLTPRNAEVGRDTHIPFSGRTTGWASTSANIFRLPSVGGGVPSQYSSKSGQITSRPSPLKSTVTLPLLNVGKLTFGDLLTTRSISALHKPSEEPSKRGSRR